MKILTDFVPDFYQDQIAEYVLGPEIPWSYNSNTLYGDRKSNEKFKALWTDDVTFATSTTKETWQLVHMITETCPIYSHAKTLLTLAGVDAQRLSRIKCNIMFKDTEFPEQFYNTPHADGNAGMQSLLYYVDDSDGDTVFFNEHYTPGVKQTGLTEYARCTPRKGTAVLFDSDRFHCSTPPRINARRAVINFAWDTK